MRLSRRHLVALAPGLLAACAPDPTVDGSPRDPFVAPTPDQSTLTRQAATAVATLDALAVEIASGAASWAEDPAPWVDWAAAVRAQCQAHLSRLLALDPLAGGDPVYEAVPDPVPAPPDTDRAAAAIAEVTAAARDQVVDAAAKESSQPLRLALASIATAIAAAAARSLPPVESPAVPVPFATAQRETSLVIALSRVWALIQGVERGLGVVNDDALADAGRRRLVSAKQLRNALRAEIDGPAPRQDVAYEMPNAMSSDQEIRAAWAQLELGVLEGWARLVAADDQAPAPRIAGMIGAVAQVQAFGGRLPWWPGWAEL
ncbi:MAG: hypothetical protein ACK5KO_10645 [Arachnia sp.]